MRARELFALAAAVPVVAGLPADAGGYYDLGYDLEPQIVVETKDCSGTWGIVTFRPARLHKIQHGDCADPDAPGQQLQQVLLRSSRQHGSYDVVWVDEQGARSILAQLQENRQAALMRRY